MTVQTAYPPQYQLTPAEVAANLTPEAVEAKLPQGTTIRRVCQVSNLANVNTLTPNNPVVLQLNGDGSNNKAYNNPEGYGSVDYANNLFDVSNCHPATGITARVTLGNNNAGAVTNANVIMRFLPDKTNLANFIDAPSVNITFNTQSAFLIAGYHDGIEAIQICLRTTTNESVRCFGVYLTLDDIVQ